MAGTDTPIKAPKFVMLAAICIICAALYFAQSVLVPMALAVLLSFLLAPLVTILERRHVPRAAAVVIAVSVIFSLLGVLSWGVAIQIKQFAAELPSYQGNIVQKIRAVRGTDVGGFAKAAQAIQEMQKAVEKPTTAASATQPAVAPPVVPPEKPTLVRIWQEPPGAIDAITNYGGNIISWFGFAGIVIVFVIFMLLQREDLRDRVIRLVGEGQIHIATQALDDAAGRISRYLTAQAIVNGTYGIAISIGLCLIGYLLGGKVFPSFLLWGLLCALLRFIPYIGPWIAATFPLAIAFAVYPGYTVFISVIAMFSFIELLSNNLMEPWLYGASTGMSTMAVIAAAVFWTWLWGPWGLLLSTPLTVCIVVIGKYVPQFAFLDILLGDQPVLEPHHRLYQRLLAGDVDEASDLAQEYVREHSLEEAYDDMFLPAMAMAETDRHDGRLDETRGMSIRHSIRDLIEELGDTERMTLVRQAAHDTMRAAKDERPQEQSNGKPPRRMLPKDCNIVVVCLPAHDEADEIVGIMLSQLLELRCYTAFSVSHNSLASEMLDAVEKRESHIICISALPPAAVAHARYLLKRVQTRFPKLMQLVGLWAIKGDLKRASDRINVGTESAIPVVTTLAAAIEQIGKIAEPMMVSRPQPAVAATSPSPQHRP